MKIIEAMKKVKDLLRKAEDLRGKVSLNSAHMNFETPTYGEKQAAQVAEWLQAHEDILSEILRLRVAIQRTNLAVKVPIELGGRNVTKTIAEWIHRRRDLAKLDVEAWSKLTDKNLKEGRGVNTLGEPIEIRITRNFDPATRDKKIELYRSEPSTIDAALEVVNAVTDIIE